MKDAQQKLIEELDKLEITSENIGEVRRRFFLPFDCEWNGIVRDLTARRENRNQAVLPTCEEIRILKSKVNELKIDDLARRSRICTLENKCEALEELVDELRRQLIALQATVNGHLMSSLQPGTGATLPQLPKSYCGDPPGSCTGLGAKGEVCF